MFHPPWLSTLSSVPLYVTLLVPTVHTLLDLVIISLVP
jgi:hypothetical protein